MSKGKGERGKGQGGACPIGHKLPLIGARLKTHFMDNNLPVITFCQRSSKTNLQRGVLRRWAVIDT